MIHEYWWIELLLAVGFMAYLSYEDLKGNKK